MSILQSAVQSVTGMFGAKRSGASGVLGIDIGSSSIKVVQLRSQRGRVLLETYGELALGPYAKVEVGKAARLAPEQLGEALRALMKEANVTATSAGVAIPFSASLITILDLPKVDKSQLARIIPIEARKYIPLPVSEVTLDWFVIPDDAFSEQFDRIEEETALQKKGQSVLLAAIQNETLRTYQTVMQDAGLAVSFFEIEIFSAIRSALGSGVAPVMIVDIGASTTKIYVVEQGIVRLSHLMNAGAQSMTEILARTMGWSFEKAERMKREWGFTQASAYSREENDHMHAALLSTLVRVFAEINRVLLSYGKRYNKNVSAIVLTGGGASLPGLLERAAEELHAEVRLADPFSKTEAPAFLDNVLREIGPGFSVALGAALRQLKQQ